ncbi:MAG: leucine-rich repeat protein, partial [Candidatus Methanomethylophilus sp.]|nr:leucine-rich repeat protein [Methanomethylophilus sp.]
MPQFTFNNDLYRNFDGAMYDEYGLTLIKIPYNQTNLYIPSNVESIAPKACWGTYLEFVHIPSSVSEIGDMAFQGCSNLKEVEFEEGLKRIGDSAFSFTALSKVELPRSLEYIGDWAFPSQGIEVIIPYDSNLAYVGASGLCVIENGSILIPKSLMETGDLPFGYRLSEIYLGKNPSEYPSAMLRSSREVYSSGQWIPAHPFNVRFYIQLGSDVSEINFDQLFGCEGGSFGGYYVDTSQGPLLVDEKIDTSLGTVYFYTPLGKISGLSQMSDGQGTIISLTISGSWTAHDIVCTIDYGEVTILESEVPYVIKLRVTGDVDGSVITIGERISPEFVTITFDSRGGSECSTIHVGIGRTISEANYPIPVKNRSLFLKWVDENDIEVTSYQQINSDMVLHAVWEDANPRIIFDENSHMVVKVNGVKINSGDRVSSEDNLVLEWVVNEGYTFNGWGISTPYETKEIRSLDYSFSGVTDDTEICVLEGYYNLSDTIRPINSIEFSEEREAFFLQWMTSFVQDTSGSQWTGGTGTPLVVNGRLYTRAGDLLYMFDLDTGRVLKKVDSKDTAAFYHYIGYANGMIFDYATQNIYDLDLNCVGESPIATKVLSDDTGIYIVNSAGISKYSLDMKELLWSFTEGYCNYFSWGVTGGIQIYDGYLYWLGVKDNVIRLQSVDAEFGRDSDELILTDFKNYMLDDGWVTCCNNVLYITVYSTGLFGDNSGATGGGVIAIGVNDGIFSPDYSYYELGSRAHSNFIVFNGRGYVNSGYNFVVFDIDEDDGRVLKKVYSYAHNRYTHGGIVLNNPPGSNDVEVIFIPYDPTMSIMVFYDAPGQELPRYRNIPTQVPGQYNTQAVRFTADGRIYFYNDTGNLFVLGDRIDNLFIMIREDNKICCIEYQGTVDEAISSLNISDSYFWYMLNNFSLTNQLEYDESIANNYRLFYFSDVPLTSAVWTND